MNYTPFYQCQLCNQNLYPLQWYNMRNQTTLLIIGAVVIVLLVAYIIIGKNKQNVMKDTKNNPAPTQPVGLKIEEIEKGTGPAVKKGDTVVIHYKGTLENGTKFDSSYDRNQPFETQIGVGQVIEGWDLGVVGMQVGGKRKLVIPPDLGYGANAVGPIPANSTLIFDVELVGIK